MRKAVIIALVAGFLSLSSLASAASFDSLKEWSPPLTSTNTYTYSQELNLPTAALMLNSATLKIKHKDNDNDSGELWYACGGSNVYLGKLSDSENGTKMDTFTLSSAILGQIMSSNPWSLYVKLDEGTSGSDYVKLYSSEICGDYTPAPEPVPEPASMILLGSALAGWLPKGSSGLNSVENG